ncbi:right-handed parallel beta-helix repeat-containing protein [Streptomyces sp. TLI_171]|uniref:right-handed parallel beta-helix repeat-containing protein n=1 Tax=Streptomyces sp. TLI_171 TaxID=1938859 RepID=UPI000C48225F|nr:right-handed parallel beta-helix repeat-containing protein [Streptomyces sp. TLI_171]RKE23153.1 pectate lyase-like protein [Streptomyces sp. TLI_171]
MDRRGLLKATGTAFGVIGGAQLVGAQGAQAAVTGPVVNVRDCGAVGNGVADETAAFQQAFAAGAGATVLIPPGVYLLTAGMVLAAGTTVSAYGARIVRNDTACSALLKNIDGSDTPGYSGPGRITVLGGTWDMAGATFTRQTDAFAFAHAQDLLIRDCTIVNVPSAHAIELNAMRGVRVLDCVFDGLNTVVDRDKEAVQITGSTSSGNLPAPPYDFKPCVDVQISGCTLRATTTPGYDNFGALCGDHDGAPGVVHTGIRVTGNHIEAATAEAIRVVDWQHAVVSGNTVRGARNAGIDVRSQSRTTPNPLSGILIQGNTVDGTGNADCVNGGVTVAGKAAAPITGLVVSGNVVAGTQGEYGIYVGYAPQAVVSGNSVVGTARNAKASNCQAIQLDYSPNSVLTDNSASAVAGDGMFVNFSDGSTVGGNRIAGCATHGLCVSSNDLAVRNNVISGLNTDGVADKYGIRIGNNAKNVSLQGNQVRRSGAATDATAAIAVLPGTNGAWITGNDLRGWGASAILDQGTGTLTAAGNQS